LAHSGLKRRHSLVYRLCGRCDLHCFPTRRSSDLSSDRSAYFISILCLYDPARQQKYFFEGRVDGRIAQIEAGSGGFGYDPIFIRSEEHTSELQSLAYLVCRLLLEKKKPAAIACAD